MPSSPHPMFALLAASVAPLAMTIGFIIWGDSYKGSAFSLNVFKCSLASSLFLLVALCIRAPSFKASDFGMITLSSFLGIVIGDSAWLLALKMIGARRVIVIDSLKPFLAAILGNVFLNEPFNLSTVIGLVISSVGILIVALEKENISDNDSENNSSSKTTGIGIKDNGVNNCLSQVESEALVVGSFSEAEQVELQAPPTFSPTSSSSTGTSDGIPKLGYIYAAVNVFLDAYGSVLTKQYGYKMNTWEINLYRFGFAAIVCGFLMTMGKIYYSYSWDSWGNNFSFSSLSSSSTTISAADVELSKTDNPLRDYYGDKHVNSGSENDVIINRAKSEDNVIWYEFPFVSMRRNDWLKVAVGVLFVTFICPALSNYALFHLPLGLCLTLNSLGPVYSLPLLSCISIKRETISLRAILGVVCVFLGVIVLALPKTTSFG